jgi:hypothetical protein
LNIGERQLAGLGIGGANVEFGQKSMIPKPTPTGSFAERNAFRSNNVAAIAASMKEQGQSLPGSILSGPSTKAVDLGIPAITPSSTNNALANLQKKHGMVPNSKSDDFPNFLMPLV